MEYLGGGSALDLMKAGSFEEIHISIILREVIKGLDYLHSERKLHRDIKGSSDRKLCLRREVLPLVEYGIPLVNHAFSVAFPSLCSGDMDSSHCACLTSAM